MNNKDLILKTARRLDKFSLDDIIISSGIEESIVNDVLANLIKENIILKNNEIYFFNVKKNAVKTKKNEPKFALGNNIKLIIIEEQEGYDYFLNLSEETKNKIKRYVELINLVEKTGRKNIKNVVELFNQTLSDKKIPYPTFSRFYNQYKRYGFKGLLPYRTENFESSIPDELYTCFKKYFLNKEKLSIQEAIYNAQIELQNEQKIEQPFAYSSSSFLRKLNVEFKKEQIEFFRNNIELSKGETENKQEKQELSDMLFKDVVKIYLERLKRDKKLEKLMQIKTNYKNHLKDFFGDLKIKEIDKDVIAKYKQKEFDNGCQLKSVQCYVMELKSIIKDICPLTNNFTKEKRRTNLSNYALNMNLISDVQIRKLLNIAKEKYKEAYPVFYISLSTGASLSELLALKWDKIDFENGTIFLKYFLYGNRLVMTKSGSTMRKLKIEENVCTFLKNRFDEIKPNCDDFVFTIDNKPFTQLYFEENILMPLSKELGIEKLNPSDLQHNFVNMCIKQNIPLTYIQKSIGSYGIVNFVRVYKKLIEQMEDKMYNPLEKI